nr:cell division protein FtsB [Halomonas elongata]
MLKWLAVVLVALLALLQYRLWLGEGSVRELADVGQRVENLEAENAPLRARNERLAAEVVDLKTGLDAIEERARNEVGMVRSDEQFFWVPDAGDGRRLGDADTVVGGTRRGMRSSHGRRSAQTVSDAGRENRPGAYPVTPACRLS